MNVSIFIFAIRQRAAGTLDFAHNLFFACHRRSTWILTIGQVVFFIKILLCAMFVFHNMKYSAVFCRQFTTSRMTTLWSYGTSMWAVVEERLVVAKNSFYSHCRGFLRGAQVFALNVTTSEIDNEKAAPWRPKTVRLTWRHFKCLHRKLNRSKCDFFF